MRLKYIKLAGFKSFADPVTLEFPDNITAIVGPNGCGKSNIVDAIRWVTGATTRNLRGESLDDIVFQGAGSRKPLGMASVELVFDNSDGSLKGRHADYAEISLRRTADRDRESKYYLNGARCRRKDIVDLLQGTGLTGNRYSVIEQGMISNIVSAKPEELRGYIEELAGVAHYKGNRRDAEARMRRTRENLDRVLDIRDEVSKQIGKLKGQTRDAERFVELKQRKKRLEADLLFLKRGDLTRKAEAIEGRVAEARAAEEKERAALADIEARMDAIREKHEAAVADLDVAKEAVYELAAEVKRLESELKSDRENEAQLLAEQAELKRKLDEANAELKEWRTKRDGFAEKHARLAKEVEAAEAQAADIKQAIEQRAGENEEVIHRSGMREREIREARESAEVEKAKIAMLEDELRRLEAAEQDLAAQKKRDAPDGDPEAAARERDEACLKARSAVETATAEIKEVDASLENMVRRARIAEEALRAARTTEHELQGRAESLRAMQEEAARRNDESLRAWCADKGVNPDARLGELMKTQARWEIACDAVLGAFAGAVKVRSLDDYADGYASFDGGVLTLVEDGAAPPDADGTLAGTLAGQVSQCDGLADMLAQVRLADSLDEALKRRKDLRPGETFVTSAGAIVARHWLRLYKPQSEQDGAARRRELARIERELEAQQEENRESAERLEHMQRAISDEEAKRKALYDELAVLREKAAELATEAGHAKKLAALEHETRGKYERQLERIKNRVAEVVAERAQSESARAQAEKKADELSERYGDLEGERTAAAAHIREGNERLGAVHDGLRRLEVDSESARISGENAAAHIQGLERRIDEMNRRAAEVGKLIAAVVPSDRKRKELEAAQERKAETERRRLEGESAVGALRAELQSCEARSREARAALDKAHGKRDELHVELQVAREREKEMSENLKSFDAPPPAAAATTEEKTLELERTCARLERMGAVNLAAVEEYKEMSERKDYLDAQNKDLTDAIDSLKKSIKKMDDESARRFSETLAKVNEHLKIVFPQLFGGGEARLEMLGDDALNDGLVAVARPPGKGLVSIHLLSGGEKALAAAAILLSIFELRPAPFCVLDEVDAPLDDQNVDRFCGLLKHMSERVQLIMATHNKISMEYADSLIGVTMREAGVTRPVSVNVGQAAELAAS